MSILNYTTSITSEKTTSEIQRILSRANAKAIMTEYDDDQVLCSMSFQIVLKGQLLSFHLPAKIDNIYSILKNDRKVPKKNRTREQASKVCWRIIKDWVEAQLALVEADQAQIAEVFLPYIQDNTGSTIYEKLEQQKFAGLLTHDSVVP